MGAQDKFKKLHTTRKNHDLVITCGEQVHKVHKVVVSSSSEWFEKACFGGGWKETKDAVIKLEAEIDHEDYTSDHPEAVKLMIDFMYLDDYEVSEPLSTSLSDNLHGVFEIKSNDPDHDNQIPQPKTDTAASPCAIGLGPLAMHARMYAHGSKFLMPELRSAAVTKYTTAVNEGPIDMEDLAAAIAIAYNTAGGQEMEMRKCVFASLIARMKLVMDQSIVREAIHEVDWLAEEIIRALVK